MTPLGDLCNSGDRLERTIFQNVEFATTFSLYPNVWRQFVAPYRDPQNPRMILADWQEFAEHHYTAIMRCWTAFEAKFVIDVQCDALAEHQDDAALLRLHGAELTFYAAIGSAWENLNDCFTARSLPAPDDDDINLRLYAIRDHYLHEVLIPIEDAQKDRLVWFGSALLKSDDLHWSGAVDGSNEDVAVFHAERWLDFVQAMTRRWSALYDRLKKRFPEPIQGVVRELSATSSPYR